jgi:DNA-binding LacI/PurR family transcriptional regulator
MVKMNKVPALHQQVEAFVRGKIESGEFEAGGRLPSTSQLAKMTGTSVFTVQTALTRLANEGLLDRQDRRGTFVTGDRPELSVVALYFNRPFYCGDLVFYSTLARELEAQYHSIGIKVRIWMDDRPELDQCSALPSLRKAVERREVQAVIAPLISKENIVWLKALSVPVALPHGNESSPYSMPGTSRDLLRISLDCLVQQGCKSLGVISGLCLRADGEHQLEVDFYRDLLDIAHDVGLEIQDDWLHFPKEFTHMHVNFGYDRFLEFWKMEHKPDGLFVFPDFVASGVVMGALECRVDVPKDLKLVLYANDQIPYPCPLSAKFVVQNVSHYAQVFREIIQQQIAKVDCLYSFEDLLDFTIQDYSGAFSERSQNVGQKAQIPLV